MKKRMKTGARKDESSAQKGTDRVDMGFSVPVDAFRIDAAPERGIGLDSKSNIRRENSSWLTPRVARPVAENALSCYGAVARRHTQVAKGTVCKGDRNRKP